MPTSAAATSSAELGRSSGFLFDESAIRSTRARSGAPGRSRRRPSSTAATSICSVAAPAIVVARPPGSPVSISSIIRPERIQVGAAVELGEPGGLLRGDVTRRAGHHRERRQVEPAGEPEVAEHDRLVRRQTGDVALVSTTSG